MASYLIPLVTLPYLTRVLGVEGFGQLAFVQAVMAYFILLTDYGFSWSATRKIAAYRNDHKFVSQVFSATWGAQWLLAALALLVLCLLILAVPLFRNDASLYMMGFTLVIGNVFFPLWLLQGLERMREVAFIQVVGRLSTLPLLFIFVCGPADILLAVGISSFGQIVAGLISVWWIKKKNLVSFRMPNFRDVFLILKDGATLFLSRITISFYTILTPLVLGMVSGTSAVAYFNLADKVRIAAQSLISPISQALFPRMSHLYANDKPAARKLLIRSLLAVLAISGMASFTLFLTADWIVLFLGGAEYAQATEVLRWLAFLPLIIGLSNVFGVQIMLPNQLNSIFNIILGSAGLLGLLIIWPFIIYNSALGAAQTILAVELFVTLTMCAYLWRNGYLSINLLHT